MCEIVVHFDGSVEPEKYAQYGFIIYKDGQIVDRGHGRSGEGVKVSHTVAEWLGCVRGMAASLRYLEKDIERLCIKGDNQVVINQANNKWKTRAEHLIPYCDAVQEMKDFIENDLGIGVDFVWHRRDKNGRADKESRKA